MDIIKRPHIDYICSAVSLSFLEDSCVEEIYASHVLEHFKRNEIAKVLLEWNRVMTIGGVLRIAVPDFKAIAEEYIQNKDLNSLMGLLYGGQNYEYNFHYQAYDYDRIKILLEEAGFIDICKYDWFKFLPSDYDDYSKAYLPHMDFINGRLMSLNIEAKKG